MSKTANNSYSLYENAFKYIQEYAYLLDKKGIFIDGNEPFLKLMGWFTLPKKQMGSLYEHMLENSFWSEKQVQAIKEQDIEAILTGKPQYQGPELPVIDGDNHISYYQFSRIPLLDPEGQLAGLVVVIKDVTEIRYLKNQLKQIKEQLQLQNANSELNKLPKKTMPSISSTQKDKPSPSKISPKILIVEDNELARKATQSILMSNDCLVDVADSESSFKEKFKPGKYDLVFMDIGFENTSGYILAKQLRRSEKGSSFHVPIIALTSFNADVVQFDCDYYQMEGSITKPLTSEQVKQLIQKFIFHINLEVKGLKSVDH